jgi:hypothetical protein
MPDNGNTAALVGAVSLVLLSGLFSGLNLGLMSFTDDDLGLVIEGSSDQAEVANAKAIRPVRAQGNLLLCTLLLGNTLVNAVIAILLSDLTSGLVGTLVTTALILVFGEIVPQSVCSRHALAVGAAVLPIVKAFVFVCWPIAYPISVLLDWLLGREISGVFSRQGLLALIVSLPGPTHVAAWSTLSALTTIVADLIPLFESGVAEAERGIRRPRGGERLDARRHEGALGRAHLPGPYGRARHDAARRLLHAAARGASLPSPPHGCPLAPARERSPSSRLVFLRRSVLSLPASLHLPALSIFCSCLSPDAHASSSPGARAVGAGS